LSQRTEPAAHSRAKDSQRFPKWCPAKGRRGDSIFMLSPSGRSIAEPAAARQLRYLFYFLKEEDKKKAAKVVGRG